MKLRMRPRPKPDGDDQMLPLINLVFLLLVFFMLVGALTPPEAFEINAPRARQLDPADAGSRTLILAADGRVGLGRAVFAVEDLPTRAAAWRRQHPGEGLQVKADAQLEAQRVVALLAVLHDAGVQRVSLLAESAR